MKRNSSRAEHLSQQPPRSKFARTQPSPRSWLSLGLHPFLLPVSHSSTSLQHSETDSELPPGRKRRQRRDRDRSKRHWAASTSSPEPPVLPPTSSWGSSPETPNLPARAESHESTGRGTLLPGFIVQGGCAPPRGRRTPSPTSETGLVRRVSPFVVIEACHGGRRQSLRW